MGAHSSPAPGFCSLPAPRLSVPLSHCSRDAALSPRLPVNHLLLFHDSRGRVSLKKLSAELHQHGDLHWREVPLTGWCAVFTPGSEPGPTPSTSSSLRGWD